MLADITSSYYLKIKIHSYSSSSLVIYLPLLGDFISDVANSALQMTARTKAYQTIARLATVHFLITVHMKMTTNKGELDFSHQISLQ